MSYIITVSLGRNGGREFDLIMRTLAYGLWYCLFYRYNHSLDECNTAFILIESVLQIILCKKVLRGRYWKNEYFGGISIIWQILKITLTLPFFRYLKKIVFLSYVLHSAVNLSKRKDNFQHHVRHVSKHNYFAFNNSLANRIRPRVSNHSNFSSLVFWFVGIENNSAFTNLFKLAGPH